MLRIRASQIFTRTPEEAAVAKKELDSDDDESALEERAENYSDPQINNDNVQTNL